jgi:hypothetical protein
VEKGGVRLEKIKLNIIMINKFKCVVYKLSENINSNNLKVLKRKKIYIFLNNKYLAYYKNNYIFKLPLFNSLLDIKIIKNFLFLIVFNRVFINFNTSFLRFFLYSLSNYNYMYFILKGIGYKIKKRKQKLIFLLGKSHAIRRKVPLNIKMFIEGKNRLILASYNKLIMLNFGNELLKLKKVNKYTNKGFYSFLNKKIYQEF